MFFFFSVGSYLFFVCENIRNFSSRRQKYSVVILSFVENNIAVGGRRHARKAGGRKQCTEQIRDPHTPPSPGRVLGPIRHRSVTGRGRDRRVAVFSPSAERTLYKEAHTRSDRLTTSVYLSPAICPAFATVVAALTDTDKVVISLLKSSGLSADSSAPQCDALSI